MKTNFFYTPLSLAIAFFVIGVMDTAKAQNNVKLFNQSVLNGLYSPTASERFFEEGRRQIERETKILNNPERYRREDILQNSIIDDIKTIKEIRKTNPIFYFPQSIPQPDTD